MEIINGIIVSLLTQGAKKIQAIPISPKQTGRIRIFTMVLTILVTGIEAYLNGNLSSSNIIPMVSTAIVSYFASVVSYHGLIK